jgi:predicted  nucleic acid-binding Zn-ribbon protein
MSTEKKITIDELAVMIHDGFKAVDEKLAKVDQRFDSLDGRLLNVEGHLTHINARLGRIEQELTTGNYERRLESLEEDASVNTEIDGGGIEVIDGMGKMG